MNRIRTLAGLHAGKADLRRASTARAPPQPPQSLPGRSSDKGPYVAYPPDRAQTGHYTNMKDMRARFNMHRVYRDYLALPQLGDEGFEERMRRVPERPPV